VTRDLPARPDLDQLRRQAKELHRAAAAGQPAALDRIAAVSDRVSLAAAQLAVAREHGVASWPRLKLEVERKRLLNAGDVEGLARLVAAHPMLAVERVSDRFSDAGMDVLGYLTVARFHGLLDHDRADELARVLLAAGAAVRLDPAQGDPDLIGAASYGEAGLVQVLLEAGADLEAVGSTVLDGTALAHAVEFGNTEVVDILVAAGAVVHDLVEAAGVGRTHMFLTAGTALNDRARALRAAAINERVTIIDALLATGVPVDADTDGSGATALHWAAWHGKPRSVRHLLDRGADPERRDLAYQATPLGWCRHRHAELARFRAQPRHAAVDQLLVAATTSP